MKGEYMDVHEISREIPRDKVCLLNACSPPMHPCPLLLVPPHIVAPGLLDIFGSNTTPPFLPYGFSNLKPYSLGCYFCLTTFLAATAPLSQLLPYGFFNPIIRAHPHHPASVFFSFNLAVRSPLTSYLSLLSVWVLCGTRP